jgi:hypothetical protein
MSRAIIGHDYVPDIERLQQISPGFSLSPSFVNSTSAPLEDRRGDQLFFNLFRCDAMSSDMINTFKRSFNIIDSHEQSQKFMIRAVLLMRKRESIP